MLKKIIVFIITIANLYAINEVDPTFVYKASGGVTDLVANDGKLYVATQASSVDIFDIKTKKLIKKIKVPQIEDFVGDTIDAKVYNTDVFNKKVLLTVQDTSGFRELYIYDNKLTKLISKDESLYISKALFVDDTHIVFCTLGNIMYMYDIPTRKILWNIDIKAPEAEFNSTFADFVLDKTKSTAVVADESGDLKVVDIKTKQITKVLSGQNLDKVFKVDIKNNKIITAGQDRRCVVYNLSTGSSYYMSVDFLIYAAGLNTDATLGAYSSDEQNNVIVFDTNTKQKLYKLKKNLMTLTSILFINDKEVFVSTDSNKFNYYKLK